MEEGQAPSALDLTVATALVLGGEGRGVRPLVAKHCDFRAAIPMAHAGVASLNVSLAAGVLLCGNAPALTVEEELAGWREAIAEHDLGFTVDDIGRVVFDDALCRADELGRRGDQRIVTAAFQVAPEEQGQSDEGHDRREQQRGQQFAVERPPDHGHERADTPGA